MRVDEFPLFGRMALGCIPAYLLYQLLNPMVFGVFAPVSDLAFGLAYFGSVFPSVVLVVMVADDG